MLSTFASILAISLLLLCTLSLSENISSLKLPKLGLKLPNLLKSSKTSGAIGDKFQSSKNDVFQFSGSFDTRKAYVPSVQSSHFQNMIVKKYKALANSCSSISQAGNNYERIERLIDLVVEHKQFIAIGAVVSCGAVTLFGPSPAKYL